jgi:hypothetical protein
MENKLKKKNSIFVNINPNKINYETTNEKSNSYESCKRDACSC